MDQPSEHPPKLLSSPEPLQEGLIPYHGGRGSSGGWWGYCCRKRGTYQGAGVGGVGRVILQVA